MMRPLLTILEDERTEYDTLMGMQKKLADFRKRMDAEKDEKKKSDYKELLNIVNGSINDHTEKLTKIRRELRLYTQMLNVL